MDNTDADSLRAEWMRLQAEHEDLARQTAALRRSPEGIAWREHTTRLHAHVEQLHALIEQMEKYHQEHGPIRGLSVRE